MKLLNLIVKQRLKYPILFLLLLWIIQLLQWWFSLDLFFFGIYPRAFSGLIGIITMPLIHGSWMHLIANSIPLFIFLTALNLFYRREALKVLSFIWIVGGFWLWVFARENYHIGASGLVFGLFSFLFVSGILSKKRELLAFSLLIWFLYAGTLWGILPIKDGVSWEGHLIGLIAGIAAAFYYFYHKNKLEKWIPDNDFNSANSTASNSIKYHYK